MKVYSVIYDNRKIVFDNLDSVIEELAILLEEAVPEKKIYIEVMKMSKRDYSRLPEVDDLWD